MRLVTAGADQFAVLVGTGLNPREEAKRQKHYPILRQMAALAPKKQEEEKVKEVMGLEDVYRLFDVSTVNRCVSRAS